MVRVLFRRLDHDVTCSAFISLSIPSRETGNSAGKSSAWVGAFVDTVAVAIYSSRVGHCIDLIDAFIGVVMIRLVYGNSLMDLIDF